MHSERLISRKITKFLSPHFKSPVFGTKRSDDSVDKDFNNMPGKSNKFDYTNRANSGAKLGVIIGSALIKESEKVKKDAERHSQKQRKQSSDSTSGIPDSAPWPPSTVHIIDLKVPGKELGDEGVCALADGLEEALSSGNSAASLALEDLNLSANGITTVSLARLAPIIELAKYDLKTLNLSGNGIKVVNDEQAAQWELFLRSFRDCMKLRRLDLSGNSELGSRALEVFARVHIGEEPISPTLPGGDASILSLPSDQDGAAEPPRADSMATVNGENAYRNSKMTDAGHVKRRSGLRSLPYITLQDVGLDDAGALWLSYIVEDHHYPVQLIDEVNATHAESSIKAYQQDANPRGLDWNRNSALGKEGAQLLERTEVMRRQSIMDDQATLAGSEIDDLESSFIDGEQTRRRSMDRRQSKATDSGRRFSIRSIHTNDGGEHEATELESARKKLQRHIIAHDGAASVELWRAALKYFRASRLLLFIAPISRKYHTGGPMFPRPSTKVPATPDGHPPSNSGESVSDGSSNLTIDTTRAAAALPPRRTSSAKASYAATLVSGMSSASGEPEFAITDVTNTPTTPKILQKTTHRKDAFGEGTDMHTVSAKLNALHVVRDDSPHRFIDYQRIRIAKADAEGRDFRDRSVPCHLPKRLLDYLMDFVMTEREASVMGSDQKSAARDRAQSRDTLMMEKEWHKKDESAQVLMLLVSINCAAYTR